MSNLHKLINLLKKADELEYQALQFFNNTKFSEVQQIRDLKSSLWGRIVGEIDTEKEKTLKDKNNES